MDLICNNEEMVLKDNNARAYMLFKNQFYNEYQHDVYSQNGEDGIIEELLKRLNITDGWVCEFGAWDGIYLSNTFNLVKNKNFNAVYIEGDARRFEDLLTTQKSYENITAINSYVSQDKTDHNSLDNILSRTDIPYDFELLSIDIDGFDYQVWKSLEKYQPKIVIIEINSSVNPSNETHIHNPGLYEGTGFQPTLKLGIEKGYKFVLHTGNMFFVRNDLYEKLNMEYSDPLENFRTYWLSRT
jgi:hypothetical protein